MVFLPRSRKCRSPPFQVIFGSAVQAWDEWALAGQRHLKNACPLPPTRSRFRSPECFIPACRPLTARGGAIVDLFRRHGDVWKSRIVHGGNITAVLAPTGGVYSIPWRCAGVLAFQVGQPAAIRKLCPLHRCHTDQKVRWLEAGHTGKALPLNSRVPDEKPACRRGMAHLSAMTYASSHEGIRAEDAEGSSKNNFS